MKLILLSGGAGQRLWPLSNSMKSKQFLQLLTSPVGKKESMLQRIYRQLQAAGLADNLVVVTGENQNHLIESQLNNEVTILTEPARRDTFPAIYLAAAYLYSVGTSDDETIVVLPCDTYTSDSYFSCLNEIDRIIQSNATDMVLVGIPPTYPSSKYGYIIPKSAPITSVNMMPIKAFREKPTTSEAIELIKEGALWNAGVYGFKLSYLLALGEKVFKTLDFNTLLQEYPFLPKLSFSYEVLEKSQEKTVITTDTVWDDLGTWDALCKVLESATYGNVKTTECTLTYIINDLPIPLVCLGCDNMIIVASQNGILVTHRDKCENIKNIVGGLSDQKVE